MPDLYVIKDWDDNFETEKTRQYKHCQRITFENNLNKPKVRRLLRHKNGIAHFGVWVAICQLHSTMSKPRTGFLTDTGKIPSLYTSKNTEPSQNEQPIEKRPLYISGNSEAIPLSLEEIAALIHTPLKIVEEAFERLCGDNISWVLKMPDIKRLTRDQQETIGDMEGDYDRYLKPTDTTPTETKPYRVVEIFHEICPKLPSVQKITQDRIRHIKARNREYPALDWCEYFKKVAASDFLMGRSEEKWSAKFDWLINPANFIKVLEGNYENRAGTSVMDVLDGS